jgi:ferrous iron transport protein B
MARAAFVMDRFMHALGLHGKSFIPMLIGFGCNIPGIMATRTLESNKDRILTILVNPLMSCSARLPIYILFAGALFPRNQGLVVFSLYLLGIVLAVIVARIFKAVFFRGEVAPLIMELPPYRLPTLKGVIIHMWERGSLFLRKAGTIIFLGVVLIWFLAFLPLGVEYASEESLIGKVGSVFAPLFKPAGFGFWQAGVALFFGILAKEVVVGTLGTLYGVEEARLTSVIQDQYTPLSAYAFMVMALVYIPCIAAIATIKKETNWKWTGLAVGYSLVLGWGLAVLIYQIGGLFVVFR